MLRHNLIYLILLINLDQLAKRDKVNYSDASLLHTTTYVAL